MITPFLVCDGMLHEFCAAAAILLEVAASATAFAIGGREEIGAPPKR
jgi:hypothetical protein